MQQLRFRQSTARGYPVGESHGRARHSNAVVEQARAWRAAGWTHAAIGQAIGAPRSSVEAWCARRRRIVAPVRIVVTRVAPSKRSINPQASPMRQGLAFDRVGGYEVAATDSNTKGTP